MYYFPSRNKILKILKSFQQTHQVTTSCWTDQVKMLVPITIPEQKHPLTVCFRSNNVIVALKIMNLVLGKMR